MKRSGPIKRKTRPRPFNPERRKRSGKPGKLGIIRLYGKDMTQLRISCYERSQLCDECGVFCHWEPRFTNDPQGFDMAHITSQGAGGSDTLENVRTLCHTDHMLEHNAGGKPIPPKEK